MKNNEIKIASKPQKFAQSCTKRTCSDRKYIQTYIQVDVAYTPVLHMSARCEPHADAVALPKQHNAINIKSCYATSALHTDTHTHIAWCVCGAASELRVKNLSYICVYGSCFVYVCVWYLYCHVVVHKYTYLFVCVCADFNNILHDCRISLGKLLRVFG